VFERMVADAPEQWWTVFFPIWPDSRRHPADERGRHLPPVRRRTGPCTAPRPRDLHVHTLASDGLDDVETILAHVLTLTDLDVLGIADHERVDAAIAARAIARRAGSG